MHPGQTAGGGTHAAQFSRWGLGRRSIPAEPRRCAPLIVAFRSKYTRCSSLTRLVSRAPRPHREDWPASALTRVPPPAVNRPGLVAGAHKRVNAGAPERRSGLRLFADWTTPADGETNMRRDQELLEEAAAGAPPSLRLYRWSRPSLTLGHGQAPEDATDPAALATLGIPWVRRPTGGRALLHLPDELTYAFAAPGGLAPGVRAAYFRVMGSIWTALAGFVRLDPMPTGSLPRDTAAPRLPCHAVATGHEITVRGQKLVAGAQRWRRGAFLQHGSIPWTVDCGLTNSVAGLPADSPVGAVGLSDLPVACGRNSPPSVEQVASALTASFRRDFAPPG